MCVCVFLTNQPQPPPPPPPKPGLGLGLEGDHPKAHRHARPDSLESRSERVSKADNFLGCRAWGGLDKTQVSKRGSCSGPIGGGRDSRTWFAGSLSVWSNAGFKAALETGGEKVGLASCLHTFLYVYIHTSTHVYLTSRPLGTGGT